MPNPSDSLASPLSIGGVIVPSRVFLAPMSGVTDSAFRIRADRHGAGLVVSEMVASGELVRARRDSRTRICRPDIAVHMVQLAGREASALAEAAIIAEGEGADIIDINMGCPARKVTGGYCGSALMREPDHALALVAAVVAAVKLPVTVKMRLGWDETSLNAPHIARRAEAEGVAMITVHGRTREQFYKGSVDWSAIRRVRDAITIPLVANGDISSHAGARRCLAMSGADAVMVGRAHYGQPWLAGAIAAAAGAEPVKGIPRDPDALADYVESHYRDMLGLYGRDAGLRHARKHLGWYLDRHAGDVTPAGRAAILTATDPELVVGLMRDAIAAAETREAA